MTWFMLFPKRACFSCLVIWGRIGTNLNQDLGFSKKPDTVVYFTV